MMGTTAPFKWRIQSVTRSQFHSADATIAYRIEDASATSSSLLPTELIEREYAVTDTSYPSCATRTYGGEPLPVEPQRLFDLTATALQILNYAGPVLHVDGSLPTLPAGAILVHAEGVQPDGTIKVAVDVKNLRSITGSEALEQFAVPAGYTQEFGPQY